MEIGDLRANLAHVSSISSTQHTIHSGQREGHIHQFITGPMGLVEPHRLSIANAYVGSTVVVT